MPDAPKKTPASSIRKAGLSSVVIPFYNEENLIQKMLPVFQESCKKLGVDRFEIIAVDDGSRDGTINSLHEQAKNIPQLKIISFNRNFGKEAAIHAGLEHCTGDIAFVMDSDGQHPVSLMPEMLDLWEKGADVVAACKADRGNESFLSRSFANGFYAIFKFLTKIEVKNMSDYVLLDRAVVDQYTALNERRRFFRGMIAWMGFKTSKVYFDIPPRVQGSSSWSRFKLFRFALNAISGFTSTPLHLISLLAFLYAIGAVIIGSLTLFQKLTGTGVTGFTTVNILVLTTGALIMFGLGQIGIYLEQIFEELKQRPSYLINHSKSKLK
ncbi:MAG: glycosyltransferase family 2 protein [Hyphomonadaceae bacterium]|nr:glycosyltransferase family 2 protein [Hyphomonadaceae bacterium]